MKTYLSVLMWSISAGALVYAVASPGSGVAFRSPLAAICLGMIGLGVCLEARKQRFAAARAPAVKISARAARPHSRG
jgi:hypothetical protein